MTKVKRLTLDRYEHGLLVRALYEEWKQMMEAGVDTSAIEDLILKVIDAPAKKRLWRA
jgi:hypothetical protein